MHRNKITLVGLSVKIDTAVKQLSKFRQQAKFYLGRGVHQCGGILTPLAYHSMLVAGEEPSADLIIRFARIERDGDLLGEFGILR